MEYDLVNSDQKVREGRKLSPWQTCDRNRADISGADTVTPVGTAQSAGAPQYNWLVKDEDFSSSSNLNI